MAGSRLSALFDDIATVLDDIAVMTKVATQKTAGVLANALALGAVSLLTPLWRRGRAKTR